MSTEQPLDAQSAQTADMRAQLGNAGWGCPDPRDPGGDFISDAQDTPEAAVALARKRLGTP